MDDLIKKFKQYTPVEFEEEYAVECAKIALEHTIEAFNSDVPSNWLDPLLTGKDSVLPSGYKYTPRDIEKLVSAIKLRAVEKYQEQLKKLKT